MKEDNSKKENPKFKDVQAFVVYIQRKYTDKGKEVINAKHASLAFMVKCQYLQWYYQKVKNEIISLNKAKNLVATEYLYLNDEKSKEVFKDYMHFVVANERNLEPLQAVMTEWLAEGGDVKSFDNLPDKSSLLHHAISCDNLPAFAMLLKAGSSIDQLDAAGNPPLIALLEKILVDKAKIEYLQMWKDADIPTDTKSRDGYTAAEVAANNGHIEATEILGGDMVLARESFVPKRVGPFFEGLKLNYQRFIKQDLPEDDFEGYKRFPKYIVDNWEDIPKDVLVALAGYKRMLKYYQNGTILEYLVFKGSTFLGTDIIPEMNELALQVVKTGIGSSILENGHNVLHYIAAYNNSALLHALIGEQIKVTDSGQYIEIKGHAYRYTPMIEALKAGNIKIVVDFIKAGYDQCIAIEHGAPKELHLVTAARYCSPNKLDMIKAVCKHIDLKAEAAVQALLDAIIHLDQSVALCLIQAGVNVDDNNSELLKLLVANKMTEQVKLTLACGAKLPTEVKQTLTEEELTEFEAVSSHTIKSLAVKAAKARKDNKKKLIEMLLEGQDEIKISKFLCSLDDKKLSGHLFKLYNNYKDKPVEHLINFAKVNGVNKGIIAAAIAVSKIDIADTTDTGHVGVDTTLAGETTIDID